VGLKIQKISFISGLAMLALSGILYTVERFIAVYKWIGESAPVKIKGSGSYREEPIFPSIFDNFFIGFFLMLGLILLITGLIKGIKKSI
jgi:hypothetical protein